MPCVLWIKGSFFHPATFLEVTELFWLQLLRKLSLNSSVYNFSTKGLKSHKGILSNEEQHVGKLQVPPNTNCWSFSVRFVIKNLHVRIQFRPFPPFLLVPLHSLFFFASSMLNKIQSCYTWVIPLAQQIQYLVSDLTGSWSFGKGFNTTGDR